MNKVYCVETNSYIDQNNILDFNVTGETRKLGSVRCAVLRKDGDSNTYLKPWDQIVFLRQRGEKNISSKLNNTTVRNIIKAAYSPTKHTTFVSLAKRYGVTPDTIANIVYGRAWTHITLKLIDQLRSGLSFEQIEAKRQQMLASVITASNDQKTKKLSPSLAKFMVRDHYINKIPVKKLASKYLVSESSVRRVVTGKAWAETTAPAIAEFSKWNNP